MSHCFAYFVFLVLGSSLIDEANANSFLKVNPSSHQERISEEEVQTSLLAEVEGTFGVGSASSRLKVLETSLESMYAALPKNEHGFLGRATVRYALHRLFVQRHGWFITGLHEAGDHRNSTSTAGLLKEQVPAYVQDLFEQRLGTRGLGLHELAVLAATIEHLVHNEAVKRLGEAFKVHDRLPTSLMTDSEVDDVLDTYMTGYILGEDLSNMTAEDALELKNQMPEMFTAWNATQEFVRAVRLNITSSESSMEQRASGGLDFSLVARVAERVGEQFGQFQDHECRQIKANLVAREEAGTGRLRLSDFWKPALGNPDAAWQFTESFSYLQSLGVLDESNAQNPRVMIANYISSHSNCIASSSFYSVCCMDECEGLLDHLEQEIAAPEASPERIAALVAELPSSSVVAPRNLSETLLSRLGEIAAGNGGLVQLHGRLFAQFMHHAFPRECPYPHVSGTTNPLTPDEWLNANGQDPLATQGQMQEQMYNFTNNQANVNQTEDYLTIDSLPWSPEEELLTCVAQLAQLQNLGTSSITKDSSTLLSRFRNVVLIAAMAAVVCSLVRYKSGTVPNTMGAGGIEKLLV